jgi:hypothetical protein
MYLCRRPPFTSNALRGTVEPNVGSVVYTAVERFDPESRPDWPKFVAWSRLTQLREIVSLDGILCPNVFHKLTAEDWKYNVHEDSRTHLFRDLDHVSTRVTDKPVNVLALLEEPSADAVASFRDARFEFCGFDLIEEQGSISALTNCGGFDRAFEPSDLSECGLLVDHAKAVAVRQRLRAEYVAGHPEPEELDATFPRQVAGASRSRPVSRPSSVCSCRRV